MLIPLPMMISPLFLRCRGSRVGAGIGPTNASTLVAAVAVHGSQILAPLRGIAGPYANEGEKRYLAGLVRAAALAVMAPGLRLVPVAASVRARKAGRAVGQSSSAAILLSGSPSVRISLTSSDKPRYR